jgi:hypothetical protein
MEGDMQEDKKHSGKVYEHTGNLIKGFKDRKEAENYLKEIAGWSSGNKPAGSAIWTYYGGPIKKERRIAQFNTDTMVLDVNFLVAYKIYLARKQALLKSLNAEYAYLWER